MGSLLDSAESFTATTSRFVESRPSRHLRKFLPMRPKPLIRDLHLGLGDLAGRGGPAGRSGKKRPFRQTTPGFASRATTVLRVSLSYLVAAPRLVAMLLPLIMIALPVSVGSSSCPCPCALFFGGGPTLVQAIEIAKKITICMTAVGALNPQPDRLTRDISPRFHAESRKCAVLFAVACRCEAIGLRSRVGSRSAIARESPWA